MSDNRLIRAATLVAEAARLLEDAGASDLARDLIQVQADIERAITESSD